jgi:hypothetical protein
VEIALEEVLQYSPHIPRVAPAQPLGSEHFTNRAQDVAKLLHNVLISFIFESKVYWSFRTHLSFHLCRTFIASELIVVLVRFTHDSHSCQQASQASQVRQIH